MTRIIKISFLNNAPNIGGPATFQSNFTNYFNKFYDVFVMSKKNKKADIIFLIGAQLKSFSKFY